MKSIVIGFGHKARQGKDHAAKTIARVYGGQFDIGLYSFAKALKEEVDSLNPFALCLKHGVEYDTNPDMTDPHCKTSHGKQPKALQFWGTYQRQRDPFYWVKKVRAEIEADGRQFAFITDMRMKNEFQFVKAFGGRTVRVTRLGYVDLSRDPNHISEVDLDGAKFDYEINAEEGAIRGLEEDALYVFDHIVQSFTPVTAEVDDYAVVGS